MHAMGSRRMSHTGSLYKRSRTTPDGRTYTRWVAQITLYGGGTRRVVRRVRPTWSEARAELAAMRRSLEEARTAPSRQSLGTYLQSWLDETARPSVAPNTARGYEDAIAHLEPIADIQIGELRAEDVEFALNRMTARRHRQKKDAQPASPKTRRNALLMLRAALQPAVDRGHLERNVARLVKLPRLVRTPIAAMSPDAARSVLAAIAGDRYEGAFALAFAALRASEILGLTWEDVDLDAGVVNVRYQLVGSGRTATRAPLKTAASAAPVTLPDFIVERLRAHKAAQLHERIASGMPTEDGHVFVTPAGLPVNGSWLTKHFGKLLAGAGLPPMRLHDLRHGTASLLAAAGVHPAIIQRYVRHASSRTTIDIYTHVSAAQERAAADVLQRVVGA
jgi:integrase